MTHRCKDSHGEFKIKLSKSLKETPELETHVDKSWQGVGNGTQQKGEGREEGKKHQNAQRDRGSFAE